MIDYLVFSVMARLIVEILFMLFPFTMLCNGLNMSEYDAHWLKGFPLISLWPFLRWSM